jgi:hypothetical protein
MSQTISRVQRSGAETEELISNWISGHAKDPFFAFLHLFEPPLAVRAAGTLRLALQASVRRRDRARRRDRRLARPIPQGPRALRPRDPRLPFGPRRGLDDHGEEEHGVLLYREEIHVPLMVKLPKQLRGGASVPRPSPSRTSSRPWWS